MPVPVDAYPSMRKLLAEVSRSFFLSLRALPGRMRSPVSLAYLLARASDTLADCDGPCAERRIRWLDGFIENVRNGGLDAWFAEALESLTDHPHVGERRLIGRLGECLDWLAGLPPSQAEAVRSVIVTIVSGQRLDVERFGGASGTMAEALANEEDLDDYTWRVAGCVGRFWSEIGFDVFGDRFAAQGREEMDRLAIEMGKGLQLVNILRDLPADLAAGRCYLPVKDPRDRDELMRAHQEWVERATGKVQAGFRYAAAIHGRRLRVASVLPAMLADDTLDLLRGISWDELVERPKVTRRQVYRALWRAWWWRG
jgi:farnesyl-diphosphate farnesyltransferase